MAGYGYDYGEDYGLVRVDTTISATTATATTTTTAPTVTTTIGAVITIPDLSVPATAPTPTVTATHVVGATPTAATATTTATLPTVTSVVNRTLTPPTASATTTAPTPTVTSVKNVSVAPPTPSATTETLRPSVVVGNAVGVPTVDAPSTAHAGTASVTTTTSISVTPPAATATATGGTSRVLIGPYIPAPTATAAASGVVPSIESVITVSVTVDASTPATATAAVPVVDGDINGLAQPGVATASVTTPFAAPNPVRVQVIPTQATTAVGTPVPLVTERTSVSVRPDPPGAVMRVGTPDIEAVSPITTLPGAVEVVDRTSETSPVISPDVSVDDVPDTGPTAANHHYRETDTTERPEFAQPQQRTVKTEEESVYTPDRRLYINNREFDVDRDIFVSAGEYGFTIADCTLYNLDVETWAWISRQDRLRIELGWRQGDRHLVFDGEINIKRRRERRHNRAYIIRGREEGASILTSRYSRSYANMSPHRIVDHLVADIDGLDRGYIATGSDRIDGTYSISKGKELNDWFDRLAKKATQQTGERWVWYIDRGEISFHPATEQASDPVTFSMDKSVVRATPAGIIGDDPSLQSYEVVMRCEPILRRGLSAYVEGANAINEGTQFRVAEYTHESNTTTPARHHSTAVLKPMRKASEYPQP